MNFFKSATFTWWQLGLIKLSVIGFGIAIGAYFQEVFLPYLTPILVTTVVAGVYSMYVWCKQK